MKISENWLREWVDTKATTAELERQLIMSGTELDGVEPVASDFSNVVVGQIKNIAQHPDADRLKVCQVDVAADELLQIVTNAPVTLEQKVPVAMIGAVLPIPDEKPLKIKKGKLRGIESFGMFCGSETLDMGEAGEGLLEIPANAKLGADLRETLDLNDVVLDLDATPNRADLLSVAGVAREIGVIMQCPVNEVEVPTAAIEIDDALPVKISCEDLCQHFTGRIIRDVNTQVETPHWMKEKLRRMDVRSLSPVIDVTNYVMLELGQPLHAYDFDKLEGGIDVRNAKEGEKLTLLDGKELTLRADTMVIGDEKKALSLGGVMGGLHSSVTDETKNIYIESAFFVPEKLMGKARTYGMHTDGSHRFERGVSPDLQVKGLERATQLIIEICGGKAGPISDVATQDDLGKRETIHYQRSRTKRHLGIEVDDARVEDIMTRLGCQLETTDDGWMITPPVFRFDLSTPEDVVEEIARIYGYDNIPARLRPMVPVIANKSETEVTEDSLRNLLIARGYNEAITYSFVPPELETLLSPDQEQIKLSNPISEELSIMRSSLWSGLIPALDKNVKRQQPRVRFFEIGLSFLKVNGELVQRKKLAGAITGSLYEEAWNNDNRNIDFYDLKGDVEALLEEAVGQDFEFVTAKNSALHPGQSATIMSGNEVVGVFGALHPAIESKLSLDQQVFVFELDLALMMEKKLPSATKISPYPSIRRDLALLLDKQVSYADIDKSLKNLKIKELKSSFIFDVYEGEHVESNQKSLALGLIFQDFSRTLEEEEISGHVDKIIATLKQETGALLR